MSRIVGAIMAAGFMLMVAACNSAYYYGVEEEPSDFDRAEYETGVAASRDRYADEKTAEAQEREYAATERAEIREEIDRQHKDKIRRCILQGSPAELCELDPDDPFGTLAD